MLHEGGNKTEKTYIRKLTARMLESLAQTQTDGFVGAVQSEFYPEDSGRLIQYNLSAWRDEESAKEWSSSQGSHKETIQQYHGNELTSFSSVLMNLGPISKGIRRHQRCLWCHHLVYNLQTDTSECSHCGKTLIDQDGFDRTAATLPWC